MRVKLVQMFCVRFLPPGLLQLTVLRHLWRTDEPAAVGSERRRPSGYWHPTLRPHIAGAPSATLATGTPARRLQGGHTRTPVAAWHFTTVPGRRLPSCRRCLWAATTFHSKPNMPSDADIQHLGDRAFGAAGPRQWNSLPSHLKDADISYSEFRRSLKTFLFGQWGQGTAWTVLIAPSRNILSYLLTFHESLPPSTSLSPFPPLSLPFPSLTL